ncbi:MAG: BNR-4 repeat-containing protein [Balneolales bacterium]
MTNKVKPYAGIALAILLIAGCSHTADETRTWIHQNEPIVFNPDGGWCWFQDERGLIDNGRLVFGSVSSAGDIIVTHYELGTGQRDTLNIHPRLQQNDHAQPALMKRPDGRYLMAYSAHNGPHAYSRISSEPGDPTRWLPAEEVDVGDRATYSNLYHLTGNDRTYNFHRGIGWHPNVMVSDDQGDSWQYGGRLFAEEGHRPYMRYASDGSDRIHFITTDGHPRVFANSIYHGYIENDRIFTSTGTGLGRIDGPDTGRTTSDFTRIFEGDDDNVAWTSDIQLDEEGYPYIGYSVTKDRIGAGEGGMDHRYRYARWDGNRWNDFEIAYAGRRLYPREDAYTGLIALHPDNPDMVYISTDAHPETGEPLISSADGERHYEIWQGLTSDRGATWTWRAVTGHSESDNIRPYIVSDGNDWAVLWLRGAYRTYTDYNLEVVGAVSRAAL